MHKRPQDVARRPRRADHEVEYRALCTARRNGRSRNPSSPRASRRTHRLGRSRRRRREPRDCARGAASRRPRARRRGESRGCLSVVPRTRVLFERHARRRHVARLGNAAYDAFSPHQDIVSDRLRTLHRLPTLRRGVLVVPIRTLLQRLPPPAFLAAHSLMLIGRCTLRRARLPPRISSKRAIATSRRSRSAANSRSADRWSTSIRWVRRRPYRIDLFDDEVASLRTFDPDTQRTVDQIACRRNPAGERISADGRCDRALSQSLARVVRRRRASLSDLSGRESRHGAVRYRVLPAAVSRHRSQRCSTTCRPIASR